MIDGKQCTILWHVDDLKMSHMDMKVLEDIIASLNKEYGKAGKLSVTRGTVHDYLGVRMDYSTPGQVSFDMEKYLDGVLEDLPVSHPPLLLNIYSRHATMCQNLARTKQIYTIP